MSEKNEKPTEKRIRDARKKGQVAKSTELIVGVQLAVLLSYFIFQGDRLLLAIRALIEVTVDSITLPLEAAMDRILGTFFEIAIYFGGSIAALLIVVTILSIIGQIGFLIVPDAIKLKGDKLNPVANLKQLFSVKSLFEVGKSLLKIFILGLIFTYLLRQYIPSFQFMPLCGMDCAFPVTNKIISWLWGTLVACYVVFALADYSFQRHSLMKQLRMSKDEIKREYKESEGSPEIKSRRRELHREIQSGSLSAKVKKSSAVVRNPGHIAVCLYYLAGETPLPQVLEKGEGEQALLIIKLADREGIPIVQNILLARALMREVGVDEYIPEHLFEPVAALLRQVMGLKYHHQGDEE